MLIIEEADDRSASVNVISDYVMCFGEGEVGVFFGLFGALFHHHHHHNHYHYHLLRQQPFCFAVARPRSTSVDFIIFTTILYYACNAASNMYVNSIIRIKDDGACSVRVVLIIIIIIIIFFFFVFLRHRTPLCTATRSLARVLDLSFWQFGILWFYYDGWLALTSLAGS
ncbi:hypothetical protein RB195_026560 [Necator americanus]|uniref:7TM GPCR serpentine receptor class x (Srx) domain-containing protein n=1 Tax=Necator americanus TaxID=51031 RepID=A0ABR1EXV8_NECAM